MGGTVRLISNQPNLSEFQSSAQSVLSGTDGGGFKHKDSLMVNLPLSSDTLALRVAGTENYTSGWIDRIVADPFPLAVGNPVGTVRGDVRCGLQDHPTLHAWIGLHGVVAIVTRRSYACSRRVLSSLSRCLVDQRRQSLWMRNHNDM
jgi:hypothetical protein